MPAEHASGSNSRVVYTVSTGGYDVSSSTKAVPAAITRGTDFIRFVDSSSQAKLSSMRDRAPWRNVWLNDSTVDQGTQGFARLTTAQWLSRDVKLRPHRYPQIWRYASSIYVDSNVIIHHDLDALFDRVENGSSDLAAYDFPRRLDDEANWVERYLLLKQSRRFNSSGASRAALRAMLDEQVAHYKAHGDHLWNRTMYGKVLVRRHGERARHFGECWWRELIRGVPRDQISMRFCAADSARRVGLRTSSLGRWGRMGAKFWRYFRVHFGSDPSRLTGF